MTDLGTSGASESSTLQAEPAECVFSGDWSITTPIDIGSGIAAADAGFDTNWVGCIGINGLFLNAINLTISGRYGV